jgi:hypothetical protein
MVVPFDYLKDPVVLLKREFIVSSLTGEAKLSGGEEL